MDMVVLDARADAAGGYKVDVMRGARVGRVSSEWFSRPADERYLSLSELYASVRGRTERSRTRTVESAAIRVDASRDNAERLMLMLPGSEVPVAPTHWSFGQLASLVGAPAAYLRHRHGCASGKSAGPARSRGHRPLHRVPLNRTGAKRWHGMSPCPPDCHPRPRVPRSGLREGDRPANGPDRQWLRPTIFRRQTLPAFASRSKIAVLRHPPLRCGPSPGLRVQVRPARRLFSP